MASVKAEEHLSQIRTIELSIIKNIVVVFDISILYVDVYMYMRYMYFRFYDHHLGFQTSAYVGKHPP